MVTPALERVKKFDGRPFPRHPGGGRGLWRDGRDFSQTGKGLPQLWEFLSGGAVGPGLRRDDEAIFADHNRRGWMRKGYIGSVPPRKGAPAPGSFSSGWIGC